MNINRYVGIDMALHHPSGNGSFMRSEMDMEGSEFNVVLVFRYARYLVLSADFECWDSGFSETVIFAPTHEEEAASLPPTHLWHYDNQEVISNG